MRQRQLFGGNWTEEKLERVRKYLAAYVTILSKQRFRYAYIDAFAGTGYRSFPREQNPSDLMFPELAEPDSQSFLIGSAHIAMDSSNMESSYRLQQNKPWLQALLC